MGMYSTVIDRNWECRDKQKFSAWLADTEVPSYVAPNDAKSYSGNKERTRKAWTDSQYDENEFADEMFDNNKIIGYWYEEWCFFMRDIAMFFEGEVTLQYEEPEYFAKLIFKEGRFLVRLGETKYEKEAPIEVFAKIPKLPNREKILRSL